jgi:hypothetical protein
MAMFGIDASSLFRLLDEGFQHVVVSADDLKLRGDDAAVDVHCVIGSEYQPVLCQQFKKLALELLHVSVGIEADQLF